MGIETIFRCGFLLECLGCGMFLFILKGAICCGKSPNQLMSIIRAGFQRFRRDLHNYLRVNVYWCREQKWTLKELTVCSVNYESSVSFLKCTAKNSRGFTSLYGGKLAFLSLVPHLTMLDFLTAVYRAKFPFFFSRLSMNEKGAGYTQMWVIQAGIQQLSKGYRLNR